MELSGKYQGRLTKIYSNHINLRTNEIVGFFEALPNFGEHFQIISEPLDKTMDYRIVTTTPITELTCYDNVYRFRTINSEYELELFPQKAEIVLDKDLIPL